MTLKFSLHNITTLFTRLSLSLAAVISIAPSLQAAKQPNIVIFLADDLGYGDLGCYGNRIIKTPHIDALAAEGVRLTDCHSGGTVCSPSRSALLTGRTPYRSGFYTIAGPEGSHLSSKEITLPSLLKENGYDTCFVGKWHLGRFEGQPNPGDHGFDHWFATAVNAFDGPENTNRFVRNGTKIGPVGMWYCDAIVKEASEWMLNRPNQEKPFFIEVSFHEPHTPVHPPEKYSKMYDNELTDELETEIPYGEVFRPLSHSIVENKKYYYGTVTQLDDAVGRMMKALDSSDQKDNTIVIFTSDNGPETPVTVQESGNQWKDESRDRSFGTPGLWRGMKRYVYEGGHRVPGIVRWPGKVDAGSISTELVNGTDWMPTVCKAAGIELPTDRTIDGVDIAAALKGETVERPIPACWMFPVGYDYRYLPSMAMRHGDMVMIGWFDPKKVKSNSEWVRSTKITKFALHDLKTDRSQANDLQDHKDFPMIKQKMEALWSDIQKEAPDWKAMQEAKKLQLQK